MCYGMGCSKESRATGTCGDPWRCAFDQQVKGIITRKETIFYCSNCEADSRRRYLEHDEALWRCRDCGHVYTTAELRQAYKDEYKDLIFDAEWVMDSIIGGLDAFTASTTPSRNAA